MSPAIAVQRPPFTALLAGNDREVATTIDGARRATRYINRNPGPRRRVS